MTIKYVVFWLGTERKIYSDDHYYTLGEWMRTFDTQEEADIYAANENIRTGFLTIIKLYCPEEG